MDIGYIDKIDPWTGNPDKYFNIKNTSLQDIYDMVGTPKELQNKLAELTKGHPSLKNALFSMPVHEKGRNFIAQNILGGMINDAIAGNNGKNSVKQKVNNYFTELYNMYESGNISPRNLSAFADNTYNESFEGKASNITGKQRYEYYQQHGIPKSNATIPSSTVSENVSNVSGGAANINETSPVFNSAAKKGHATAVEEYINNRKTALRASGDEKLASSVDNIITPQVDNIDRSAELDNFNKILDRQFGKQKTVLSDEGTHAGSRSENGSLDSGKEYTAQRRLENAKKVLDEHKIDYNNMSEEKILEVKRNLKKDYWNKRKAALGGHGKAALVVGTAVTAGALVLGLSNSRGQQSNAQLYGQQPLSY